MYKECVRSGGCKEPSRQVISVFPKVINYYKDSAKDEYPVVIVSWNDAKGYCEWVGRRLPTEAEWEKAARGTDGRLYPWGDGEPNCGLANSWGYENYDTWNDRLGVQKGCNESPIPVASLPDGVSIYGVYDMIANVGEWVSDFYSGSYFAQSPKENPPGAASGDFHVIRGPLGYFAESGLASFGVGGHQYDNKSFTFTLRVTHRTFGSPKFRTYNVGFRCAVSP